MQQSIRIILRGLPGLAAGLFLSRFAHEWIHTENPSIILSTSLLLGLLTAVSLRTTPLAQTWPLLFLFGYVFYPQANPLIALLIMGFVLVVWSQWHYGRSYMATDNTTVGIALLSGVAFLILYIATLAPDILPADNGEFQLVAPQLGVAHPPGFPLYTLLSYGMTHLPWGVSPAYRINLLSAFTSSATLVFIYLSIQRLTRNTIASLTGVLALGTATTFWAQATTANIRSLTGLFTAMMLYTLIGYKQAIDMDSQTSADHALVWFGLTVGLGLTHHASLVFITLICGFFILFVDWTFVQTPRRWIRPLLAVLAGLTPLLYIPLRAHADAPGASPELATFSGFLNHILARGFRGDFFYFSTLSDLWERLKVMGNVMTFQFQPWLLVGMGIGLIVLLRQERRLAFLLCGSFVIHTFITATYRAPQTVEYMIPAYVAAAILLGCAAKWRPHPTHKGWVTSIPILLMSLMLVTAVYQGIQHYPSYIRLHVDTAARDYAQSILTQAPPASLILADWHWVTPLWYLQEIEHQRPDVQIRFVYPEASQYAETWAQRIAEELGNGRTVVATHFDENAYQTLPPPEPIGEAFLFQNEPRHTLPHTFTTLNTTLGSAVQLLGYQLQTPTAEIGQTVWLTVAWQPLTELTAPLSLFAHLTDKDGQLFGQEDLPVRSQTGGINLTQFRLISRPGAMPGDFNVSIGAYTTEPLLSEEGEARTFIATLTLRATQTPPFTQNPVHYSLSGESRTLIGYDWDNTLPDQNRLYLHWQTPSGYITEVRDNLTPNNVQLPVYTGAWNITHTMWNLHRGWTSGHYVPFAQGIVWTGERITQSESSVYLSLQLTSSRPIMRDLVVSARLIGYQPDGFQWAWTVQDDSIPAMGAIPTLKWIAHSQVRSPYMLNIDSKVTPGQTIAATLRIYDAFTNRPLPILDERITNQFPWVPLGPLSFPLN